MAKHTVPSHVYVRDVLALLAPAFIMLTSALLCAADVNVTLPMCLQNNDILLRNDGLRLLLLSSVLLPKLEK